MRFLLVLLLALPALAKAEPPSLMLWAWEREEDLRFLDPQTTGVAYLAGTLYLRGMDAVLRPRFQPLRLPPGTYVTAVVRIEPERRKGLRLNEAQRLRAVEAVARIGRRSGVSAVQIDFDATVSERQFYALLLRDLRQRLPQSIPISITALASWCIGDRWIQDLPVDDAVPMLFRMGRDGELILRDLARDREFPDPLCRHSLGISTDEPEVPLIAGRRIYAFHPEPWSREAVAGLSSILSQGGNP